MRERSFLCQVSQLVFMQEVHPHEAQDLRNEMSSYTDGDDMKALRTHCLRVETPEPINKSDDPASNENPWFDTEGSRAAMKPDDTEARKSTEEYESLCKTYFDRNGEIDEAVFPKTARLKETQARTKTATAPGPRSLQRVRLPIFGHDLIPYSVFKRRIVRYKERVAATTARAAFLQAGKLQLKEAGEEYERAYQENLWELEFGPGCYCIRSHWQHELHPSGTMKRREVERAERNLEQFGEDVVMEERDGAET